MYEVALQRSTSFYVLTIIVPTIIVTCLSFVVFWAPPASADALGYGITVIVVVILMQVGCSPHLPSSPLISWSSSSCRSAPPLSLNPARRLPCPDPSPGSNHVGATSVPQSTLYRPSS